MLKIIRSVLKEFIDDIDTDNFYWLRIGSFTNTGEFLTKYF